jgi:probable HAF family extracellular repeat protein
MKRRKNALLSRRLLIEVLERRQLLATSQPLYTLTELQPLPDRFWSNATGINNASQIVGNSFDVAALWNDPSNPRDLGVLPGFRDSFAYAISPNGTVVGNSNRPEILQSNEPWLWSPSTGMQLLEPMPFNSRITMHDLNDTQTVGVRSTAADAVIWDAAGGLRSVPFHEAGDSSANGINISGQVVGSFRSRISNQSTEAFLWDQRTAPRFLGDLPGGEVSAVAFDVSDTGYVVGDSSVTEGSHAFLWHASTGMIDLGALPAARANAVGSAVNNVGQVVGRSIVDNFSRAVYWDAVMGLKDLNTLVDAPSHILIEATDINDLGQIVANGTAPDGTARGYLLTPLNQPPVLNPASS